MLRAKNFTPLLLLAGIVAGCASATARPRTLDLHGLVISVSDSRTAQIFHVVDQLSQWDSACHQQYVRWARRTLHLGEEDRAMLRKHAELRRARGWGNGFEQAFYVDDSIDVAARLAIERHLLTPEEAEAEKAVLLHFDPILSGLLSDSAAEIRAFRARLTAESAEIAPVVGKLVRFSGAKTPLRVPVFLIPNPEEGNGGGGFNGGRLAVEIERDPDPLPTLYHECFHALLASHQEAIRAAALSLGLDPEDLNEGITHAVAPGIVGRTKASDPLADALVRNLLGGPSASDRKYLIALVIRPLLRSALEHGQSFESFLPRAVAELRRYEWNEKAR